MNRFLTSYSSSIISYTSRRRKESKLTWKDELEKRRGEAEIRRMELENERLAREVAERRKQLE